mmetsp:Transcript_53775/g.143941  ORF Transcript_53775/g.143941 Transcript_53775/m.143941 type:complete len:212 (-) Transcript_53775:775-1410(-)
MSCCSISMIKPSSDAGPSTAALSRSLCHVSRLWHSTRSSRRWTHFGARANNTPSKQTKVKRVKNPLTRKLQPRAKRASPRFCVCSLQVTSLSTGLNNAAEPCRVLALRTPSWNAPAKTSRATLRLGNAPTGRKNGAEQTSRRYFSEKSTNHSRFCGTARTTESIIDDHERFKQLITDSCTPILAARFPSEEHCAASSICNISMIKFTTPTT